MLKEQGFLSPDLESSIANFHLEFQAFFDLVNDTNRLAMKVLLILNADRENPQQILSVALCARTIQSFQASILLAERGMIADARTMLRSCAETAIIQLKNAEDADFVKSLNERHEHHALKIYNSYLKNQKLRAVMAQQDIKLADARAEKIKSNYPGKNPSDINLAALAKEVNAEDIYAIYRFTSGDAAHATLNALERHLLIDGQGNLTTLLFEPSDRDLLETLHGTLAVCLRSLDSAIMSFALEDFRQPLGDLVTRCKAIAVQAGLTD